MAKKRPTQKSGPAPVESIRHKDKRDEHPHRGTARLRGRGGAGPQDHALSARPVARSATGLERQGRAGPGRPRRPGGARSTSRRRFTRRRSSTTCRGRAGRRRPAQPVRRLQRPAGGIRPDGWISTTTSSNWSNRMILGDSLLVMTSAWPRRKDSRARCRCIYIDPPYGIKFGSNWQVSTRKRDVKDGKAEDATRQPEQVRAFRDTWKLGIHSYLAYLRDRLVVARELLTETGSVFVQIGDENVHLVRNVMDEVFGSENFVRSITVQRRRATQRTSYLPASSTIFFGMQRRRSMSSIGNLFRQRTPVTRAHGKYTRIELRRKARRSMTARSDDRRSLPRNAAISARSISHQSAASQTVHFSEFEFDGKVFTPCQRALETTPGRYGETCSAPTACCRSANALITFGYLDDFPALPLRQHLGRHGSRRIRNRQDICGANAIQDVIERCLLMTTDPGDLVLDPTCGSGTTAYVAEQWGRRWITRHQPRRPGAGPHPADGRQVSLLPAGRLARGHQERSRTDRQDSRRRTKPKTTSARASSTSACPTSRSNPSPTTPTSRKA